LFFVFGDFFLSELCELEEEDLDVFDEFESFVSLSLSPVEPKDFAERKRLPSDFISSELPSESECRFFSVESPPLFDDFSLESCDDCLESSRDENSSDDLDSSLEDDDTDEKLFSDMMPSSKEVSRGIGPAGTELSSDSELSPELLEDSSSSFPPSFLLVFPGCIRDVDP